MLVDRNRLNMAEGKTISPFLINTQNPKESEKQGELMSFIFAEKSKSLTAIYSDTKVTFDERSKLNWGEKTRNAMGVYGIIKSIIVRDNCCVSFAGNDVRFVHELLQEVADLGEFSEDQLLDCAWKIHKSAPPDDIEFIICTADDNDETHITCISLIEIVQARGLGLE